MLGDSVIQEAGNFIFNRKIYFFLAHTNFSQVSLDLLCLHITPVMLESKSRFLKLCDANVQVQG